MSSSSTSLSVEDTNTVSWVLGAFALALSGGRFYIRWRTMGGFRGDDWAHLAAVIFLVADLALFTGSIPQLNQMAAFVSGQSSAPPDLGVIQGGGAADSILFFSCLWSVKLAFLLFYRYLFNISKGFNIAWWAALAFNVITYWVVFAGDLVQCGGSVQYLMNLDVCTAPDTLDLDRNILIFSFALIVSSDLVTMALPLAMLHHLHMRSGQKAAIGAIFCLSLVCIAFDALRFSESLKGLTTLNALWIHLEEIVAVIVSALPTYYALVNFGRERASKRSHQYDSYGQLIKSAGSGSHTLRGSVPVQPHSSSDSDANEKPPPHEV